MEMEDLNIQLCGNCKEVFDYEEAAINSYKMYGIRFDDKVCPYCGSPGFTAFNQMHYYVKYEKTNDVYN